MTIQSQAQRTIKNFSQQVCISNKINSSILLILVLFLNLFSICRFWFIYQNKLVAIFRFICSTFLQYGLIPCWCRYRPHIRFISLFDSAELKLKIWKKLCTKISRKLPVTDVKVWKILKNKAKFIFSIFIIVFFNVIFEWFTTYFYNPIKSCKYTYENRLF